MSMRKEVNIICIFQIWMDIHALSLFMHTMHFLGLKFTFDIQQTSLFIVAWATLDYEVFFSVLDTIDCAI